MKRSRWLAAGCALCLAVGAFSGTVYAYAVNADIKKAKDQVSTLEEEKKKTEQTLNRLESLKSDTESYVCQLDSSLNTLSAELTGLEDRIGQKEEEINAAQAELEKARETESHQYETMKLRIQYMYERGETSFVDLLLQSDSISQLLNRAEYISKITEYDRAMMVKFGQAKDQVADREAALETERQELLALQESTRAKQDSVKELMGEKQKELTGYNNKIVSAQADIKGYEADIKAQEAQMKKIEAEMKRKEEEARKKAAEAGKTYTVKDLGNISFMWPCPSSSRITSGFGDRESPTEGASSFHKGIDIGAVTGADILAAADGEVVISTYSYSAGNYIMIDHGGGVSTVYMHCSQLLVSKGEKVKQGQLIAKVGSTWYSTGSHLHFGIRSGGTYVNPRDYVSP